MNLLWSKHNPLQNRGQLVVLIVQFGQFVVVVQKVVEAMLSVGIEDLALVFGMVQEEQQRERLE